MRRIIACLLSCCLLLSLLPMQAGAVSDSESAEGLEDFIALVQSMTGDYQTEYIPDTVLSAGADVLVCIDGQVLPANAAGSVSASDYMVPAERIAEAVGGEASYDDGEQMLTIAGEGTGIELPVPNTALSGEEEGVSTVPRVTPEGVIVPLSETAEQLGLTAVETEDGVTLSYTYQTARLIVEADARPQDAGAIAIGGGYHGYYLVQYADAADAMEGQRTLLGQDGVLNVAPDSILQLTATGEEDYSYQALTQWSSSEEDYLGFSMMNKALAARYGSVEKMPEVVVAVLDSGVDTDHPFLNGRLLKGVNLLDSGSPPEDDNKHGTHVAGIIVDSTLPNVKILPVKIAGADGKLTVATSIAGIEYAVEQGAEIINMSFGGVGAQSTYTSAIETAYDAGILSVVSAGNDGKDANAYMPASVEKALTVSNISAAGVLASTSNFGSVIDLAAPGQNIYSSVLDGSMAALSGTSMAAPFVSAAAAVAYTLDYDADTQRGPSAEDLTQQLCDAAIDYAPAGKDDSFGYGCVCLKPLAAGVSGIAEWGDGESSSSLATAVKTAGASETIRVSFGFTLNETIEIDKPVTLSTRFPTELRRGESFSGPLFHITGDGALTLLAEDTAAPLTLLLDADGDPLIQVDGSGALTMEGAITCTGSGNSVSNAGEMTIGGGVSFGTSTIELTSAGALHVSKELTGTGVIARLTVTDPTADRAVVTYTKGIVPAAAQFRLTNEGWELSATEDGLVLEESATYAAMIGETGYETLAAAFDAAQDGERIVLTRDAALTESITLAHSVTLSSPEGYRLERGEGYDGVLLDVPAGVALQLGSGDDNEALTISGGETVGSFPLLQNAGEVVVNNGVMICGFRSETKGVAAVVNTGTLTVSGGEFFNNSGFQGGAVYNSGTLEIQGGTFRENVGTAVIDTEELLATSTLVGGAVFNKNTIVVSDGLFTGNSCTGTPGSENNSYYAGACICNYAGTATINGGTFTGSRIEAAKGNGGAIVNNDKATLTINGGSFSDNRAYNGGAVYNRFVLNITDGTFSGNHADYNGGAVYDNGTLTLSGGQFNNNYAGGNGGAVYTHPANVSLALSNGTFTANHAGADGGAVYADLGSGGSNDEIASTISNLNCRANEAANGGALYLYVIPEKRSVTITGGTYQENTATGSGGAVYLLNLGTATLVDGTYKKNSAGGSGGGIFAAASSSYDINPIALSGSICVDENAANGDGDDLYSEVGPITLNTVLTKTVDLFAAYAQIAGGPVVATAVVPSLDLANLICREQGFKAIYDTEDNATPYEILWIQPIDSVAISGDLTVGASLTATVNGGKTITKGATVAWSYGEDGSWTTFGDGNNQVVLNEETAGKRIKVEVTGDGKLWQGSANTVSEMTVGMTREAAPNIVADYLTETLTGFESAASYKVNGGTPFTVNDGKLPISESWFGTTIEIIRCGDETHSDSLPCSRALAARPAAPEDPQAVLTITALVVAAADGYDLRLADGEWAGGGFLSGLERKKEYAIQVRVAATETGPASPPADVNVTTADAADAALTLYNSLTVASGKHVTVTGNTVQVEAGAVLQNSSIVIPNGIILDLGDKVLLSSSSTVTVKNGGTIQTSGTVLYGCNISAEAGAVVTGNYSPIVSSNVTPSYAREKVSISEDNGSLTYAADMDGTYTAVIAQYDAEGRLLGASVVSYTEKRTVIKAPMLAGAASAAAFLLDGTSVPAAEAAAETLAGA